MSSPELRGSRAWWTRGRAVAVGLMASLALNAGLPLPSHRDQAPRTPHPQLLFSSLRMGRRWPGRPTSTPARRMPPASGSCSSAAATAIPGQLLCTATPTLYGWLCAWNTATVPNGTYVLVSGAINSAGVAFSSGVSVTVDNLPLYTQVLVPSAGTTVGGNVVLDASAEGTAPVTGVTFTATQGSTVDTVGTATPTLYGWIAQWASARVLATHLAELSERNVVDPKRGDRGRRHHGDQLTHTDHPRHPGRPCELVHLQPGRRAPVGAAPTLGRTISPAPTPAARASVPSLSPSTVARRVHPYDRCGFGEWRLPRLRVPWAALMGPSSDERDGVVHWDDGRVCSLSRTCTRPTPLRLLGPSASHFDPDSRERRCQAR